MSLWKWTKRGAIALAIAAVGGFFFFGTEFPSYVASALGSVKKSVRDSVPVEVEIQRGRELLQRLGPELRDDIRHLAEEEVEVTMLERDIERQRQAVDDQRGRLRSLRSHLATEKVHFAFGNRSYSRAQVVEELSRCLEGLQSAENLLESKAKHLSTRRETLAANIERVEKKKLLRTQLAAKIDALESEHAMLQTQCEGSGLVIDDSTLSQVQNLIGELEKRLQVTRKVMEKTARFPERIPVEGPVDEHGLIEKVDTYLEDEAPASRL